MHRDATGDEGRFSAGERPAERWCPLPGAHVFLGNQALSTGCMGRLFRATRYEIRTRHQRLHRLRPYHLLALTAGCRLRDTGNGQAPFLPYATFSTGLFGASQLVEQERGVIKEELRGYSTGVMTSTTWRLATEDISRACRLAQSRIIETISRNQLLSTIITSGICLRMPLRSRGGR